MSITILPMMSNKSLMPFGVVFIQIKLISTKHIVLFDALKFSATEFCRYVAAVLQ